MFFLKLTSLAIPGMIEPWPECQPQESRPRGAQPAAATRQLFFWQLDRQLKKEAVPVNNRLDPLTSMVRGEIPPLITHHSHHGPEPADWLGCDGAMTMASQTLAGASFVMTA